MPHVCLVDKFGAIYYNGELKNINLPNLVDELI